MLTVTFSSFSKVLGKSFTNVEQHRSMDDARLRASALNWSIVSAIKTCPRCGSEHDVTQGSCGCFDNGSE